MALCCGVKIKLSVPRCRLQKHTGDIYQSSRQELPVSLMMSSSKIVNITLTTSKSLTEEHVTDREDTQKWHLHYALMEV